jgi:hypothetical protein
MDPSSGEKKFNIFSFTRMWRNNFYFFFIRISVVVWINFLFSPFLKHVCIVSCWVHDGSPCCPLYCFRICIFSWYRRTNIRPTRVALSPVAFSLLLVRGFWIDTTRRYSSWKGPSEVIPIRFDDRVDKWGSKFCTWTCENRKWWLPLRALRHRLWDSSCSCSLTQSLCLWSWSGNVLVCQIHGT